MLVKPVGSAATGTDDVNPNAIETAARTRRDIGRFEGVPAGGHTAETEAMHRRATSKARCRLGS